MNISSNYDYYRYLLYGNSGASILGQQQVGDTSGNVMTMDHVSGSETEKKVQSPLASLVEDGTITKEQEEAIRKALEQARLAHQTQAGAANASSDPLASLVEAGTISEEQSDAAKSTLASAKGPRMMAPPPPPASSEEEEENVDTITEILDSLISAGTITDEEKDSILAALEESFQSREEEEAVEMGMMAPPPPPSKTDAADISDILDELTAKGTISAVQQKEIVNALQEAFEAGQANNDTRSSDLLDSLVEDGTITEAQQAAVKSAFESAMKAYEQAYPYDSYNFSNGSFSMNL